MEQPYREGSEVIECSIRGCPGELDSKLVVHTVRHRGRVLVIDDVPAQVCSICGDILFPPETVRHIEAILAGETEPSSTVPLFKYA